VYGFILLIWMGLNLVCTWQLMKRVRDLHSTMAGLIKDVKELDKVKKMAEYEDLKRRYL